MLKTAVYTNVNGGISELHIENSKTQNSATHWHWRCFVG